ncbi:MAG: putative transcriptional regulator [Firmicutes bacterium]|nr:putative transcriptional regulator [Bacillota bacterium]
MNTLHYKYAVEVDRTRSITQAAENLFMAQPNLSKAIKELEDTLGIIIFKRTSRGVVPTAKGSEFLVHARNILSELDKMESLSTPKAHDRQCFSVSIPRVSYIASGFTDFVAALDPAKEIDVDIQETSSLDTITSIAENSFNFGVIRFQIKHENYYLDYLDYKNLSSDLIWESEYLALMSENHPLAKAETFEYSDLFDSIEIVHGDTVVPYLQTKESRREEDGRPARKKIYVYERCSQFDMLANVPTAFMWVSPVPEAMLRRYGLIQRACCMPGNRFKDLLVYPKGYCFSELDKKFIDKIYAAKNEVAFKKYF